MLRKLFTTFSVTILGKVLRRSLSTHEELHISSLNLERDICALKQL